MFADTPFLELKLVLACPENVLVSVRRKDIINVRCKKAIILFQLLLHIGKSEILFNE
jgi:hypothetical protein